MNEGAKDMRKGEGMTSERAVLYRTEMPVLPLRPIPSFSSMSLPDSIRAELPDMAFLPMSNTFQNLRSSSLLAVATVIPSGLMHECRIRAWCACGISAILPSDGYDQSAMWWSGTPWVDKSSLPCGFHASEVTCEVVTRLLSRAACVVFQKWIVRSEDPPPDARSDEFHGHHARACKGKMVTGLS